MTTAPSTGPLEQEERREAAVRSDLNLAWIAVLLIPLFFLLAFGAGYLVSWWLVGDATDTSALAAWQVVLIVVPATVILLVPCVAAFVLGRRAARAGRPVGWVPAVTGAVVGVAWTVLNVASALTSA